MQLLHRLITCDKLSVHNVDIQYTAYVVHACMFDFLPVAWKGLPWLAELLSCG